MFAVSSSIVLITVIKMQYATNREKRLPSVSKKDNLFVCFVALRPKSTAMVMA